MSDAAANATVQRLRWRCRRGTRELDALFGNWLEERYASATPTLQHAFADLLEQQDPDLWDWVMGRAAPEREEFRQIIDEIRARHRL